MADDGVLMGTMAGATQTMVNMGTMNLGITSQGSFRAAAGSNPWALDDPDYEDDFEEYNPLALDDQETRNEKCKILSNMEDLVIAPGQGGLPNEDQQVREKVGVSARSSKAAALRDRCKQALGHHFASVYAYLRRVRSQEAASIDEAGVQRALHELVGQDKALLQGCFLTDQLVFQEMMFV
ncbi:protein kinase domain-containing protein [Haematococcus lacustris]|uniref:Protein kinase domain-containing protein n=1 Tax=Haematococcus lacustris TaxID=44745 RepID=A0A699ZFD1_HAELA|nr:protein kinase domain-containing protein [Haematococcus lacustris]